MGPMVLGVTALAWVMASPPIDFQPDDDRPGSYLFKTVVAPDGTSRLRGEPYRPEAGDLLLFDAGNRFYQFVYRLAGTDAPTHATIAFTRPDGRPALLDAGPNLTPKVLVQDIEPRLHAYDGAILVRRLRTPLAEDQAHRLTEFALAQEGKPYARGRLILQCTPFRARGPLGALFGKTSLNRGSWICGELTAAACTAAGVLSPKKYIANAMYPRDFAYDERFDLSPYYEPAALWYPRPELEMVGESVRLIDNHTRRTLIRN